MKAAIIGLSQSGKTTAFKSLTGTTSSGKSAAGQDVHLGNVKVPDDRLDRLAEIFKPPKVVHADIDFMDVTPVRAELKGVGLTQQVVAEIRSADALLAVVRTFGNPSVVHPAGSIDPLRDIKDIEAELSLMDLMQVEKRLERIEKEHSDGLEKDALLHAKAHLDSEQPLRLLELNGSEHKQLVGFSFLSQKPLLLLLNIGEDEIGTSPPPEIASYAGKQQLSVMPYCAEIEYEIAELEPEEQKVFLEEMGLAESGKARLITQVYQMLDLVSFFTIADTEIRSWSVPRGTHAVEAAGKVHTDMARGFIRAETINFSDFEEIGSMQAARDAGHVRLEGKNYVVCDGDMIRFRFHV